MDKGSKRDLGTKKYILTLDQGTSSSRAIVFDSLGKTVSKSQVEFSLDYPKAGYVQCDAQTLWNTQKRVMEEVLKNIRGDEIEAIGIANQRETVLIWDRKSGEPLHPAVIWQCRRSARICEDLKKEGLEEYVKEKTGLLIDAYFSGPKIKWILDEYPDLRKRANSGDVCFGTVDSWILWNLTGGEVHATDFTNASRTMLFDIQNLCWDEYLLEKLSIPASILPTVKDTSGFYGKIEYDGVQIPVTALVGDQQSALFGQTCFEKGEIKNTYGTGCFILCNTGNDMIKSEFGLLSTIAWKYKEKVFYALEGSVFNAGSAVQWLKEDLGIISDIPECDMLAGSVNDSNGTYFVPAFTGLGAPYWDMYARGTVTGMTRATKKEHFARAVLESIAFLTDDVLEAMGKDSKIKYKSICADGGASASDVLMQFQSDISGLPVKRPENGEITALGAAFLAGLATGFWESEVELKRIHSIKKTFNPQMNEKERLRLKKGWSKAVERSKNWVDENS